MRLRKRSISSISQKVSGKTTSYYLALKSLLIVLMVMIGTDAYAQPMVQDDIITWPDSGWYQVQRSSDYSSVCEGGTSCQVPRGYYNIINHDSGERWENIAVGPSVNGSTISWMGDDWYQVQNSDTLQSICEGRNSCTVVAGNYTVINLTTGKRWEGIVVNLADSETGSTENISPASQTLVLNLIGTGAMYTDTVPAADGLGELVEAWCFDVDLVDMKTGNTIGTATDCLDPSLNGQKLSDSGLGMIGTTYFNMPEGMLAIQGRTTVQPRNWPTREFTHITGGNSAGNAVLYGTGEYEGVSGTARLSGMVDLSRFDQTVGSLMTFDCLFVVELNQ